MIFFSSDHHFGHKNIIKYCNRPWNSVYQMNEALIKLWNETVQENDTVFYLGDFAMGKLAQTVPLAKRLNGHKYLIPGNHDSCWSGNGHKKAALYEESGFYILDNYMEMEVETEDDSILNFILCHFPTTGDHSSDERFLSWRPKPKNNEIVVHGHVHDTWKVRGNNYNIGCDVWDYKPVDLETLIEFINSTS